MFNLIRALFKKNHKTAAQIQAEQLQLKVILEKAQVYLDQQFTPLSPTPTQEKAPAQEKASIEVKVPVEEKAPVEEKPTPCEKTKAEDNCRYSITSGVRFSITSKTRYSVSMPDIERDNQYPLSFERAMSLINEYKEEPFYTHFFKYLNQKHFTPPEVYKRAGMDKRYYSKLISNSTKNPPRDAAIALSIALKLDFSETKCLIEKAGYTLTHSSKRDILIEYCINEKIYDVSKINEVLAKFEQQLL